MTTQATTTTQATQKAPATPKRRRWARRTAIAVSGAAAAVLLAACGGDAMDGMDHGSKDTKSGAPAAEGSGNPAPGAFNDADVMFAQMMIPHHEQALEMSALADGRAQDAEIRDLAAQISRAQDPEIRKMKSWLKGWGRPESAGSMPGMDHGSGSSGDSGMAGMMTDEDMAALRNAKGKEFDRRFAELMIEHHKGAIEMAEEQRRDGRNATARQLAGEVVKAQQTEVDEFTRILARL
jgi:uncharacterized protein (DUF305 family)